jgi:hypothetical protein
LRLAIVIPGCAIRTRVYLSSAISLSKSATADLDAQARNPYSLRWLWIPDSLAEPVIGPAKSRTRWLAIRNDGCYC